MNLDSKDKNSRSFLDSFKATTDESINWYRNSGTENSKSHKTSVQTENQK